MDFISENILWLIIITILTLLCVVLYLMYLSEKRHILYGSSYDKEKADKNYELLNKAKAELVICNNKYEQLSTQISNDYFKLYKLLGIDGCDKHTTKYSKKLDGSLICRKVEELLNENKSQTIQESENEGIKVIDNNLEKAGETTNTKNPVSDENASDAELEDTKKIISEEKKETKKEATVIKYASFPRSSGSMTYFSDLSESKNDESFFELLIDASGKKATFKPLEFLKIRGYDDTMLAVNYEGVKPNMAKTIIGIIPGNVVLEGNMWKIEKQANIKLA